MGTDDILGKAKDEPATVADDELDEAAERIAHDTTGTDDDAVAAEPSVSDDAGNE